MDTKQAGINDFLGTLLSQQPARKKKAAKPATSAITAGTRRESYEKTNPAPLTEKVMEVLGSRALTAREIAEEMHRRGYIPHPARAVIQPRITELVEAGKIETVGKVLDKETQRKVAVYKVVLP